MFKSFAGDGYNKESAKDLMSLFTSVPEISAVSLKQDSPLMNNQKADFEIDDKNVTMKV